MIEICLGVISLLIICVAILLGRVHKQKRSLAMMKGSLENRAKENADLRLSLDRRKSTHAQSLEEMKRHYEKKIEDEKRAVVLEWMNNRTVLISKHNEELRKQDEEVRSYYGKQVDSLRAAHQEHHRQLIRSVEDLIEPRNSGECFKVRCHTSDEGDLWARKFEADRNFPKGTFRIYRCRACPRNPIYGDRYVHITTNDPKFKQAMIESPIFNLTPFDRRLYQRFSPADLSKLRKRVQDS